MGQKKMEELSLEKWLNLEQKILNAKINGKKFVELTVYRGIALWWFIRFRLYYSARTNPLINSLIKNTFFFLFTDFSYDFSTSMLCKALSGFFKLKEDRKRKFKVLITAQNRYWGTVRIPLGRLRKCDSFFYSIINELKRRDYEIVTVYPLGYSISGVKIMLDKLKRRKDITHKAFNINWSIRIWKKTYDARRYFRNIWKNNLEKNGDFIGLRKYRRELSFYFNSFFERVVKTIEMAKELVEKEEPDLILIIDEYGVFGRALIVAGKLKKIPTLAIQHGNIGLGYMYPKGSVSVHGSAKTPYCPIPDKTAVFGRYYCDLLTKMSAYPPSRVVITGQPRYDVLTLADRVFDREKFCSRLNLNPDKKIVLVATEGLPILVGEAYLRSILTALKTLPDLQIVIKPHPREKGEWYKRVVKEENVEAVVLPKVADTLEALYVCDLLIASFSTVITESIILGKPSVTLHLSESEDPAPYYKDVTLRVYKKEDLVPAIRETMHDEKTREKLKKTGKKFVFEHAYKQDGKATERIVNVIEEMILRRR